MMWTRSSFCADRQCVEAAFVKSTFSATNGTCVEAAPVPGRVLVRDGKNPDGTVLDFSRDAWYGFLEAIRAGELDDLQA